MEIHVKFQSQGSIKAYLTENDDSQWMLST